MINLKFQPVSTNLMKVDNYVAIEQSSTTLGVTYRTIGVITKEHHNSVTIEFYPIDIEGKRESVKILGRFSKFSGIAHYNYLPDNLVKHFRVKVIGVYE